MIEILAKINIAIGLLMLLGSTTMYSFTNDVNKANERLTVRILNSYKDGEIDEAYYHLKLKQTTFLNISIHLSWISGLVYCGVVITTNIILLVAVRLNHLCLLQFWLIATMNFDVVVVLFLSGTSIFGILLFDITNATLFIVICTLIFVIPAMNSWCTQIIQQNPTRTNCGK